ncbi:sulfurtransferase TusA family protein [Methylophaga sp. OBS1]|jgi:TusA-related sulfurtransferase|uniref:sulfurtransferase TusA family protein n=1 Tax=Methylophaga sp. OBS1 TaxID=2991933 RepID=UPI002256F0E0|nr:sulfurtransferase TusA family protein [Methylophaga sp. OBS1]MCX4193497.1 sulfurtransferase TusA family protein [Methylophaga sp. OBS1]
MSVLTGPIDLTQYGCPMHYIKAREAISHIELEQDIELWVNSGDAVTEVLKSLRQDGQQCEVVAEEGLTTTIRVRKKR